MKPDEAKVLQGKKVLIVDDDPDFLFQQETILQNAGCVVLSAANKKEAEALIQNEQLDAMVVDLMIDDDDDGFVLAYHAKKTHPHIPVIMVTGVAHEKGISFDASTEEERNWIKADLILAKPIRAEQVIGELQKLMEE